MATSSAPTVQERQAVLYQRMLAQVLQAAPSIMANVLSRSRQALMGNAKQVHSFVERERVAKSLGLLERHQSDLCAGYALALDEVFKKATPQAALRPPKAVVSLQFDELELMDADQVQESVVMARAQQSVLLVAEMALAEFNTYVCAALGFTVVQPERNPVRPDVFLQALHTVLQKLPVPASVRMDWLPPMGTALGQELCGLYGTLSKWLADQGVAAAAYAVRHTAGESWATPALAAVVPPRDAGERARPDPSVLTLDRLRSLLTGELDSGPVPSAGASFAEQFAREFESGAPAAEMPKSANFESTVPAALEALQEMNQVDHLIERIGSLRDAAQAGQTAATPTLHAQLRSQASGIVQVLGLEVVALMVDNIVKDARLLDPVKQLVKSIEPALLRLALVDPRFFSDKQHPARRLMQEITQRSLAFEHLDARGFPEFLAPLQQAVLPLADQPIENAQPFEQVLTGLHALWQASQPPSQLAPAVKALQQAEARHLLAEKMAAEIQARPDCARVPASVMEFLCGPWAQVMAHARLEDASGQEDPGQYRELVLALLWSAQPELTRKNVAKLTRLIPKLLAKLREGLESIGYPALKTSAFFEALMNLHQQAFKPASAAPVAVPEPQRRPSLRGDVDAWVAPAEAKASGFLELPELPAQKAAAEPELVDMLAQMPEHPVPTSPYQLPVGAWVEICILGNWVRAQLTWASPHGSLFLFTNAEGGTHSMTRNSRDKLLSNGQIRVLADQPLVDGALDAVVQTALRNSIVKP